MISKSPSPVPQEKRQLESLSPEELLDLARRQKEQLQLGAGLAGVKKEKLKRTAIGDTGGDENIEVVGYRLERGRARADQTRVLRLSYSLTPIDRRATTAYHARLEEDCFSRRPNCDSG